METLFRVSNILVLPFWFLMILLPRWNHTERVIRSLWIVIGPAILYAALVVPRLNSVLPLVLQPQPGEIAALLGTLYGATVSWAHFLAFDLFVGRWVYLDSRERKISSWYISPILCLVLMLGPLGLLLYLLTRSIFSAQDLATGSNFNQKLQPVKTRS